MQTYLVAERFRKALDRQTSIGERRRNWMSRSQIAFNSGDLVFQKILMLRPYPVTVQQIGFPETRLH